MACFLFLIPNSEQSLHTLAMAPAKLRAIWFEASVIFPLWPRVMPIFKILAHSQGECHCSETPVGLEQKKAMLLVLRAFSISPFVVV